MNLGCEKRNDEHFYELIVIEVACISVNNLKHNSLNVIEHKIYKTALCIQLLKILSLHTTGKIVI